MVFYAEGTVVNVLEQNGALTGRELAARLGIHYEDRAVVTGLWAISTLSPQIISKKASTRYLRIDSRTGKLYVSPSVPREFSDFTAVGVDISRVDEKVHKIKEHKKRVSEDKKLMARTFIAKGVHALEHPDFEQYLCAVIAGDVAYEMACDAPREALHGEYVNGSDMDLIVLKSGAEHPNFFAKLDEQLLFQKSSFL